MNAAREFNDECNEVVEQQSKESAMEDKQLENLKNAVIKFLVSEHELLMDDAEETVSESVVSNPDIWNENADATDLAKFLASDEEAE